MLFWLSILLSSGVHELRVPMQENHQKVALFIEEKIIQFSSVNRVQLFPTQWTAARQASLPITNSQSPPKPMSIESVMPFNHLILCRPLLHPPSIFPSIRVLLDHSFSIRDSKRWIHWGFWLIKTNYSSLWWAVLATCCKSQSSTFSVVKSMLTFGFLIITTFVGWGLENFLLQKT